MHQYGVTPPMVTDRMLQYAHTRYALLFVRVIYSCIVLLFLLQVGWLAAVRDWLQARCGNRFVQLILFLAVLQVMLTIFALPYQYLAAFYLEHQFGLSDQSLLAWLGDFGKARAVGLLFLVLGWSVFWAVSRLRRWLLILWSLLTPLIALSIFVYPVLIDPLFNKYADMPAGSLKSSIETLAKQAGVLHPAVFVVDKSKQTNTMNAEVTGLGDTTRIVIWDTTLKLPEDQVLAIVGHELGHYVLRHVLWGFLLAAAGLLVGLWIVGQIGATVTGALPPRWRVNGMRDLMIIPVAMLLGTALGFLLDPIDSAISRVMEHQADAFGLHLTANGPAMARAFVSLSNTNLSDPDPPPIIQFWFFGHPSLRNRIDFALGIKTE
jgi:Zn-dependent protease with chaperone function